MACRWFANYNFCDRCGVLHRVSKFPTVFVGRIVDRCDVLHRVSKFPTVFGGRVVGRCGVLHVLKFPAWHVGG